MPLAVSCNKLAVELHWVCSHVGGLDAGSKLDEPCSSGCLHLFQSNAMVCCNSVDLNLTAALVTLVYNWAAKFVSIMGWKFFSLATGSSSMAARGGSCNGAPFAGMAAACLTKIGWTREGHL